MKQFIKFTNPEIITTFGDNISTDEYVVCLDSIEAIFKYGYCYIKTTNERLIRISDEDYEMAKRILLEDDQSITPTDGNDAGPAIETLEKDADPETKEKELIKRVMKEFNNNIVGASMRLGISVNSLRSKLRKYGLSSCE